jgi:hypothetical protein
MRERSCMMGEQSGRLHTVAHRPTHNRPLGCSPGLERIEASSTTPANTGTSVNGSLVVHSRDLYRHQCCYQFSAGRGRSAARWPVSKSFSLAAHTVLAPRCTNCTNLVRILAFYDGMDHFLAQCAACGQLAVVDNLGRILPVRPLLVSPQSDSR